MAKNKNFENKVDEEIVKNDIIDNSDGETNLAGTVDAEPKAIVRTKTVIIPKTVGDEDTYVTVCINGNVTQIKKGVEVEVQEEVFNLLKRGGYLGTI